MASFLPPFIFVNIKLLLITVGKVRPERAVSVREKEKKKFEKHFYGITGCCLPYVIVYSNQFPHCIRACSQTYKHHKIVIHLGAHMFHHELHIEQFDLFLEKQSFTHRRNKYTKDVARSSCRILNKNFVVFIKGHISYLEHLPASDKPKRTITKYLKKLGTIVCWDYEWPI